MRNIGSDRWTNKVNQADELLDSVTYHKSKLYDAENQIERAVPINIESD